LAVLGRAALAGLAASLAVCGAQAQASTLYGILNGGYVESFDATTLAPLGYITTPGATGLAFGGGTRYVSTGGALTRYDALGAVMATHTLPPGFTVGSLVVGGGEVYGILNGGYIETFDGASLAPLAFIGTPGATGLAYGGGDRYVAAGSTLTRYDALGAAVASYTLPQGYTVGSLVFAPSPAAVPEPSIWVIMIFGFAMVGTAVRRRGPAIAHG
jgi:hypothetical protein